MSKTNGRVSRRTRSATTSAALENVLDDVPDDRLLPQRSLTEHLGDRQAPSTWTESGQTPGLTESSSSRE
jgi:hypothetical protein